MTSRKHAFLDWLILKGIRAATICVGILPIGLSTNLGALVGTLIHSLIPIRRKVVRQNLEIAFGETHSPEEQHRIAKMTYRHVGMLGAECLTLWHRGPEWLKSQIVDVEGESFLQSMLGSGKPFLIVTGHMGNWEMIGAYFAQRYPLTVLAKPLHNVPLDRELSNKRLQFGMQILSTSSSHLSRDIFKAVRDQRTVCFLADQDARKSGIFTPLFGRPASTFTGPALLSVRLKAPLLPAFVMRLGPGRHRAVFRPPIHPPEDLPINEAIATITHEHVRVLEDMIRRAPSQYFWFHRRWKTRPPQDDMQSPPSF